MTMRLSITAKDVKAEKLVKPGWYATRIVKVEKEPAKDKQSENYVVDVEGLEGDSTGVPCKVFFSEKFIQSILPLIRATGPLQGIPNPTSEETGLDPNYDLQKCVGNQIAGKWVTNRGKTGEEKGRNAIDDWAPLEASSPFSQATQSAAPVAVTGFGG